MMRSGRWVAYSRILVLRFPRIQKGGRRIEEINVLYPVEEKGKICGLPQLQELGPPFPSPVYIPPYG